jgi:hypothetical protein
MRQVSVKINTGHSLQDLPADTHARMKALFEQVSLSHGLPSLTVLSCAARNGCIQLVLEVLWRSLTQEQQRHLLACWKELACWSMLPVKAALLG